MLVCNVSLRPARSAIAASVSEAAVAIDASTLGQVVFATLVDDPASVRETVNAYLGEIMVEAAAAAAVVNASMSTVLSATLAEMASAVDQAAVPAIPAKFDGTPSGAVTVSVDKLTVTHGNTSNGVGVFSQSTLSTGKYYFEIKLQTAIISTNGAGLRPYVSGAFPVMAASDFVGGIGINMGASSTIYANGTSTSKVVGAQAIGDVFCFAIDLTARLGWIRRNSGTWNGDAAANPATGTNGVSIPSGALAPLVRFASGAANADLVGNFGQSSFAFTVPSGFTSGWTT